MPLNLTRDYHKNYVIFQYYFCFRLQLLHTDRLELIPGDVFQQQLVCISRSKIKIMNNEFLLGELHKQQFSLKHSFTEPIMGLSHATIYKLRALYSK